MKTVLGSFHPHLEQALVEEICRHKANDPLLPELVLVPSDSVRRRLKIVLTRAHNLSWVNLQLLTFHQLFLRLSAEINGTHLPIFRDDLFLEEVLRQMIRTKQPGTEPFAGLEERAGGCAALWQTLRDLRDGMVEPLAVLEALREADFTAGARARVAPLLELLETLGCFCKEKGIKDYSDLVKETAARAAKSRFLSRFGQILYYGFYDLTQIQIDFFYAVAQNYPTTLFFPLLQTQPSHEGWSFAERFYLRYLHGRSGSGTMTNLLADIPGQKTLLPTFRFFDQAAERPYAPVPKRWRCKIINAFGIHDEVAAAAKEIVRLVADDGMAFNDIGVVARSLEAYGPTLKEIFHDHCIPMTGTIEEPLLPFPLTKAVILLLNLPTKDYLRTHVIGLLSSPYFRPDSAGIGKIEPRPDLWDLATRELAICKGVKEWQRLEYYTTHDLVLSRLSHDDEPRSIRVAAAQILGLANIFNAISRDLNALPPQASWAHYVGAWKELLKKYLGVSGDKERELENTEDLIGVEIIAILDRLAGLDMVQANTSLGNFSQTFEHWLEHSMLATPPLNAAGVAVLDAAAARGQFFRALFILGLNEGVFPRTIREDAFLRDRDREILERDLGFKVNPKLAGFDEEKLLFTLLVNSAHERLYCSFQRANESGRPLAPSWYLAEVRRALKSEAGHHLEELFLPRSIADKIHIGPFDRDELLLAEELAVCLTLDNQDPTDLIEALNLSPALYKQGRQVVERLDLSSGGLDAFDGVIGLPSDYWRHWSDRGVSPTALETYSRCPFQFFACHVLGLIRPERPEDRVDTSPTEVGELGHLILKLTYQELIQRGYFRAECGATDVKSTLTAIARRVFVEHASNHPVGYPLVWEILQEGLTELLCQVALRDLEEISISGYVPVSVETDAKDRLGASWPEPLNGLTIRGRMDRIDRDVTRNRLRVIDYKFKFGRSSTAQDKDLYRAALRGERLQPPFYFLLANRWAAQDKIFGAEPEVEASFYYIAPGWRDGPLITASFGSEAFVGKMGDEIKDTVAYLARGIHNGRYFIRPGDHCRYCEVAEICRKNHPPSLWRAENDPLTASHRQLCEKDPQHL
ncbi:MAG TPA: PD-(D/E)XK nuclease family protein [Candidatus Binatia bacterium]|nr:PD-(D/E)XK nuclease family protein [Candidatus Binatia bacterium]